MPWISTQTPPPPYCHPQSEFLANLSSVFNTCIPTYQGFISVLLGNLSILAWLCAQLPQVIKNYQLHSTTGLSIYFLIEWLLGDTTNLVGAILTHQATWQMVLACYYTTIDLILVGQHFYYTWVKPGRLRRVDSHYRSGDPGALDTEDPEPPTSSTVVRQREPLNLEGRSNQTQDSAYPSRPRGIPTGSKRTGAEGSSPREKLSPTSSRWVRSNQEPSSLPGPSPKTLLTIALLSAVLCQASPTPVAPHLLASAPAFPTGGDDDSGGGETAAEAVGHTVSWLSAFLYLGSRLPQIYKNHARRSTAGLSPALFAAAFTGNLFYSASLLANPLAWRDYPPHGARGWAPAEGSLRAAWVSNAVPFFLGAAGVLLLDLTVGLQFLYFGTGGRDEPMVVVLEDEGPGRATGGGATAGGDDASDDAARAEAHWRRVSGWMRGWIPSPRGSVSGARPRPRPPDDAASDDERPLLQRGNSYDERRQYGGAG